MLIGAFFVFSWIPYEMIAFVFASYFAVAIIHCFGLFNNLHFSNFNNDSKNIQMKDESNLFTVFSEEQSNKKQSLLNLLIFVVMPYFPIVYLLGILKVLNGNNQLIAYCIGSVIGKGLFCSYLSNSHVCLQRCLVTVKMKLDEEIVENRLRQLIANVAHDLKTVCFLKK